MADILHPVRRYFAIANDILDSHLAIQTLAAGVGQQRIGFLVKSFVMYVCMHVNPGLGGSAGLEASALI